MTAFVESFATQQLLPPWKALGARRWCFVFRMSEQRIRRYLETYFNGQYGDYAPYFYTPLSGQQYGLVNVSYFPNIESTNTLEPNPVSGGAIWDKIRHSEVYVAFPALRHTVTADGLMRDPKLVWVQPAIYSDNDTIVFSAREIWGADMFLATIDRQVTDDPDDLHLDVGMIGVETFDPRAVDQLLACLHVRAAQKSDIGLSQVLQANGDLSEFVSVLLSSGFLDGHEPPAGFDPSKYPRGVELNNLKQFRDCYDMAAAIYRAIVASRTSLGNVRHPVLYDAASVDLAFMWSDSLKEFLTTVLDAEPPPDNGPPLQHRGDDHPPSCEHMNWRLNRVDIKVELAFSVTADIDFRVLETLHTYRASA